MIIFAIDGLDKYLIEKYDCRNFYVGYDGQINLSEHEIRLPSVLWSSFILGTKVEKILDKEDELWKLSIIDDVKLSNFKIIDFPGISYDKAMHKCNDKLMTKYFQETDFLKKANTLMLYNANAIQIFENTSLSLDVEIHRNKNVIVYFSVLDDLGHLNLSNKFLMGNYYQEVDSIIKQYEDRDILIVSCHGLIENNKIGRHTFSSFWSSNFMRFVNDPEITDFYDKFTKAA